MNGSTRRANKLIAELTAVKVIVTQIDGQAFAGLVIDLDTHWLKLREAEQLGPQGSRVGVDGDLVIPRERIAYLQRP